MITSEIPTDVSHRPRVLTVLPDFPFPATTGLHLRHRNSLERLYRLGCYNALLYFTTEEREPPAHDTTPLASICHEMHHAGRRFPHREFSTVALASYKLEFLLRGALGLPGKRYPFSLSYDRIGAEEIVLDAAQKVQADFVVLSSIFMHYSARLRQHGFQVIIDAADVLTTLSASFLATLSGRGGKLGLFANHVACRSQERIFLKQCAELWATSESEAEQFRRIAPGLRVLVVPNSLDENDGRPSPQSTRPIVGFIGTYSYAPNLRAAQFLAEQVFPRVRRERPDAVLRLAGAGMPQPDGIRLQDLPGVELPGRVEDSGRFMDECAVLALAVFERGGVPLKLVEGLARGKALVVTPELVAGLELADGRELLVRSGAEEFAVAILELLRDEPLRANLGAHARAAFERHFSISSGEEKLRRDSVLMKQRSSASRPPAVVCP